MGLGPIVELFGVFLIGVGFLLGLIAFVLGLALRGDVSRLSRRIKSLELQIRELERRGRTRAAPRAEPAETQAPPAEPSAAPPPTEVPDLSALRERVTAARDRERTRARPRPPELPAAPAASTPSPVKPKLESFEAIVGKRWMTWVGAIVLFFSAGFFLKYAFENEWIGPTGQVALCALAGLIALVGGRHFLSKAWRVLGQGLTGLGLAVLYVTLFAAFHIYDPEVLGQTTAFTLMVAVTLAGMTLAVLHNALSIAFVAVLGGLLTPVLCSTGANARDTLFAYLLLLELGVLGVAFWRSWRALDVLAMVGFFGLYGGWYGRHYTDDQLVPALAWLGALYVVFLGLPFAYHLVRRVSVPVERFVLALANATFAFGFAWTMLHGEHDAALGFIALALAATYVILGGLVRRRLPDDARALFGAIALATAFLSLAIPLHLRAHGITVAWAAEGPILLYLGYRFRYRPVRMFGAVALVLAIVRLFAAHWPLHEGFFTPYANRQFLSALVVPVAMGVYALLHHRWRANATASDQGLKRWVAWGAGMLGLVILHAETGSWLENDFGEYPAICAMTALWGVGALLYLLAGVRARSMATWGVGAIALAVALLLGMASYDQTRDDYLLFLNLRFLASLFVVLCLFAHVRVIGRSNLGVPRDRDTFATVVSWAGILGLLVFLSAEVYCYCETSRSAQMAITLVWGLYATALLAIGFLTNKRPLRLCALGLFGVASLKLVLIDLTHMKDIYRVISFMGLGLLMIGASYLYHRLEKRLLARTNADGLLVGRDGEHAPSREGSE